MIKKEINTKAIANNVMLGIYLINLRFSLGLLHLTFSENRYHY